MTANNERGGRPPEISDFDWQVRGRTPPAITLLLSTSPRSDAIARSGNVGHGRPKGNSGYGNDNPNGKENKPPLTGGRGLPIEQLEPRARRGYSIPSTSRTSHSEAARIMSDGVHASMAPNTTACKVVMDGSPRFQPATIGVDTLKFD
jgi:hypothetical protein